MLNQVSERTLHAAILPPRVGHIDGCFSLAFKSIETLASFAASCASLPVDFFVKTTGKTHFRNDLAALLPVIEDVAQVCRSLLLNSLTRYYADLWSACCRTHSARSVGLSLIFDSKRSLRFPYPRMAMGDSAPHRLRTPPALVEIDVLAARALGLTLENSAPSTAFSSPCSAKRTATHGMTSGQHRLHLLQRPFRASAFSRPEWEKSGHMTSGFVERTVQDDTLPGGPRNGSSTTSRPSTAAIGKPDYATAWKFFGETGV